MEYGPLGDEAQEIGITGRGPAGKAGDLVDGGDAEQKCKQDPGQRWDVDTPLHRNGRG